MNGTSSGFVNTLLSPPVLLTILAMLVLAALVIWLLNYSHSRRRSQALGDQRTLQEATIERLMDSVAEDKKKIIADYEAKLLEQQDRIAALEQETARLRDRLTSSGILGLFGSKQRDVVGALLLENEQLHELLARKQEGSARTDGRHDRQAPRANGRTGTGERSSGALQAGPAFRFPAAGRGPSDVRPDDRAGPGWRG